jgi:two-component system, NarL family, response regulator LiaR
MSIRILLADDHVVLRQGLSALLQCEPDFEVVAQADNGQDAIDMARQYRPDVVVMDVLMPGIDGITATQMLHDEDPSIRVVILSSLDEDAAVVAAVRAGAIGYLRKNAPIGVVVQTIRGAARGEIQFSTVAAARLVQEVHQPVPQPERLTRRELEVLECITQGLANKEIARRLRITEKTVKTHVSTILGKLGLESRTQAAVLATRTGLLASAPPDPDAPVRLQEVARPLRPWNLADSGEHVHNIVRPIAYRRARA